MEKVGPGKPGREGVADCPQPLRGLGTDPGLEGQNPRACRQVQVPVNADRQHSEAFNKLKTGTRGPRALVRVMQESRDESSEKI